VRRLIGLFIIFACAAGCSTNPAFVKASEEYQRWTDGLITDYLIEGKPIPESLKSDDARIEMRNTIDIYGKAIESEKE